jgi:glycosyltransferase involved in cell wall biosynthesis
MKPTVAVLIPCLNEELTIRKVVKDFRLHLPEAEIHVFDNASTDGTRQEAEDAGAVVHTESRRGKGFVVQSMFQKIDADIYLMVDGDDTYPAEAASDLIAEVASGEADMAVGSRLLAADSSFRPLNRMGNQLFLHVINCIFGTRLTDVLSGYRAMSRRFVKGLPLFVTGFEVEVEMTIKTLERGYRLVEKPTALRDRPQGSHSKLRKFRDGYRILWTILALMRDYKPLTTFGAAGLLVVLLGLLPGAVVIDEYLRTGLIRHFPSAVLAVGMVLCGLLGVSAGLVLHTVNRRFQELDYLVRLRLPQKAPGARKRRRKWAKPAAENVPSPAVSEWQG